MTNPRILPRLRLFPQSYRSRVGGLPLNPRSAPPGSPVAGLLSLPGLALATTLLAGCAASAPDTASRDADVAETLKLAHEARLELQTQSARLAELEGQVRDLSEMLAWSAERDGAQDRALDSLRPGGTPPAARTARPASPVATSAAATSRAALSPDEATAYRKALDLYFARQYAPAIAAFGDLLARWPQGAYADNATYWIGESRYGLAQYSEALSSFQLVLTSYPKSAKADDAQLKLGYCHLKLGDTRRAGEEFRKLVSLHPSSEYVERARGELAKLGQP